MPAQRDTTAKIQSGMSALPGPIMQSQLRLIAPTAFKSQLVTTPQHLLRRLTSKTSVRKDTIARLVQSADNRQYAPRVPTEAFLVLARQLTVVFVRLAATAQIKQESHSYVPLDTTALEALSIPFLAPLALLELPMDFDLNLNAPLVMLADIALRKD